MKQISKSRKILALLLIIPMLLVSLLMLTACGGKKADADLRQNTYYCHYDAAQNIYHYVAVKSGNKFEYVQNKSVNPEAIGSDVVSSDYSRAVRDKKYVYTMTKEIEAVGTAEAYTLSIEAVVEDANTLIVTIRQNDTITSYWTFQNLDLDYGTYYVYRSGSLSAGYSYSYLKFYADGKVDYKDVTSAENPNEVDVYATGTYEKTVRADVCIYTCSIYLPATDTQQGRDVSITVNVQTNELIKVTTVGQGPSTTVTYSAWTND